MQSASEPRSQNKEKEMTDPISWQVYEAIASVTAGVDEVARQMEDRWGVGRLPLLVGDEMREKFNRQLRRFDEAIVSNDVERVRQTGAATTRAWQALDQAATDTGQQQLQSDCWEVQLEDGRVVALCRTNAEAHAEVRSGRHLEVWTVDEIARIMFAFPGLGNAKQIFPGALIESVRTRQPVYPPNALDDEMPEFA
jgi:hypothetical protein